MTARTAVAIALCLIAGQLVPLPVTAHATHGNGPAQALPDGSVGSASAQEPDGASSAEDAGALATASEARLVPAAHTHPGRSGARPPGAAADEGSAAGPADAAGAGPSVPVAGTEPSAWLVIIEIAGQEALTEHDIPVIWKGAAFHIADWDEATQKRARDLSIPFEAFPRKLAKDVDLWMFELHEGEEPPDAWKSHILYRRGLRVVVDVEAATAEKWVEDGFHGIRLPSVARGWQRAAELVPYACGFQPLISDMLGRTNQAQFIDWIRKMSGVDTVNIGGTNYTIATRNSSTMFSGAAHAKAFEYAQQEVDRWRYRGSMVEVDPFTGSGGQTWKNLIVTIPGQTTPNEVVLMTGHYDSTSPSASTLAPGANDNGTGSSTLFEAARLLRQFRFQRTVSIIFFTGEEQGLLGSRAYTLDHPMAPILGVVNLDMFGWDGNNDRCFEIHIGTLPQSLDVGSCYRDSIASYSLNLPHDFLTVGATDRSDHASFWQVNVGAIEIAENFFTNSLPGGCIGSDANPHYHTVNDTLALNVTPSYAFDIAKAGLATIAAMAIPIQSCFTGSPALTATPRINSVDLSWTPVTGATVYRLFRSTQSCQGQWFEIAETAGTTWTDSNANTAINYHYHVEAVASDGFCVSAPSACSTVQPTVYRTTAISTTYQDTCPSGGPGSANGIVEPGESVVAVVTLRNDGNAALNSVSGQLSIPTAGITVTDSSATWPNLSPGNSAPSLPDHVAFRVSPLVACGTIFNPNLLVGHAEGTTNASWSSSVGATGPVLLLDENFSAGIPPSWTVVDGGSGGSLAPTWTTGNPGNRSIGAPFNPPFAIVDSDRAGSGAVQDEQLITPTLNASACQSLTLRFSNQFRWYSLGNNEMADVDVTTNGGATWTNVLRMAGASDGYTTPNTKTVNLMPAIGGNPANVRIRFRYHNASYEWWWAVDNVQVECAVAACNVCPASTPPGEAGVSAPLTVQKESGDLVLSWGVPPNPCSATSYGLYVGDLGLLRGSGYSHDTALTCGAATASVRIPASDPRLGTADYFLVVASSGSEEGSYGRNASGVERRRSSAACSPFQNLASCGP